MDAPYQEEQQAEALKKWLKENGPSLALGVAFGLAGIVGFRYWQDYTLGRAQQASMAYEQFLGAARGAKTGEARQSAIAQGTLVANTWGKGGYADLARLEVAALHVHNNERDKAMVLLDQVAREGKPATVSDLARLRLARLKLDAGDPDAALALLGAQDAPGFEGDWQELRGDIGLAKGDREAARLAWEKALPLAGARAPLVEVKLDDVGGATNGAQP